jgi:hypothetical protein
MKILVTVAREHLFKKKISERKKKGKSGINKEVKIDGRKRKRREREVPYYGYRNS